MMEGFDDRRPIQKGMEKSEKKAATPTKGTCGLRRRYIARDLLTEGWILSG